MHYPEGSAGALDSTKVKFYFYPQNTSVRSVSKFLINEGLPPDPPFYIPPNQITVLFPLALVQLCKDVSLMSIFSHMHLLVSKWNVLLLLQLMIQLI